MLNLYSTDFVALAILIALIIAPIYFMVRDTPAQEREEKQLVKKIGAIPIIVWFVAICFAGTAPSYYHFTDDNAINYGIGRASMLVVTLIFGIIFRKQLANLD